MTKGSSQGMFHEECILKSEILVPLGQVRRFAMAAYIVAGLLALLVGFLLPLPARACPSDVPSLLERLRPHLDLRQATADVVYVRFAGTRQALNEVFAGGSPTTTDEAGKEPVYNTLSAAQRAASSSTTFLVGISRRSGQPVRVVTTQGEELMLYQLKGGCGQRV